MTIPPNPYVAGGPVGGQAAFVGRSELLADLTRALRRPDRAVALITGLPGTGRTSLLDELANHLADTEGLLPVRFDLRDLAWEPLDAVVAALATDVGSALELTMPELGPWAEARFVERYLPRVLAGMLDHERLVLILDEFPIVWDPRNRAAASAFLPWLAGLMEQFPGKLGAVLTTDLRDPAQEAVVRRYLEGVHRRQVGALEAPDAWAVVRHSHLNRSLKWSTEGVEGALHWSGSWAYPTQLLCSVVWSRARAGGAEAVATVRRPQVDEAVPDALAQGQRWFEALWVGLPAAARLTFAAVAAGPPHGVDRAGLAEELRRGGVAVVVPSLLEAGPQELLRQGLLEEDGAMGESRLRASIPLFRAWVAEQRPLAGLLPELEHIDAEADRLAADAHRLWEGARHDGDRREAAALVAEALDRNPNHLVALELMAAVHESRGDLGEAITLLTRCAERGPARVRARLVALLVVDAQAKVHPAEQAEAWRRVLQVAPGHAEATRALAAPPAPAPAAPAATAAADAPTRADVEPPAADPPALHRGPAPRSVSTAPARGTTLPPARGATLPPAMSLPPTPSLSPRSAEPPAGGPGAPAALPPAPPGAAPLFPAPPPPFTLAPADEGPRPIDPTRDWTGNLPRLQALETTYQDALIALEKGEIEAARALFGRVAAERPTYRDTARLLYLSVTGADPELLRRRAQRVVPGWAFAAVAAVAVVSVAGWTTASLRSAPEPQALSLAPAGPTAAAPAAGAAPPADAPPEAAPDPAPAPAPPPAPPPPSSASALTDRGWRQVELGDFEGAERSFDKAVRARGGPPALYGRGYVAEQRGQVPDAIHDYCEAMRGGATGETLREVQGRLRVLGKSCG